MKNRKEYSRKGSENLHVVSVQNIVIYFQLEETRQAQEGFAVMCIDNDSYSVDRHRDVYFVDPPRGKK